MPIYQHTAAPRNSDFHLQLQYSQILLEQSKINAELQKTKLVDAATFQAQLEQGKFNHSLQVWQASQKCEFDVTKYVKLVPEFNEQEVNKLFAVFEKFAKKSIMAYFTVDYSVTDCSNR